MNKATNKILIPMLEYKFLCLEEKYRIGLEEEIQSLEKKLREKDLKLEAAELDIAEIDAELGRVKSELLSLQSLYQHMPATRKINNEIDF